MSKAARIALRCVTVVTVLGVFLALLPSLIGFLMVVLLTFALFDYSSRRYRQTVKTFNSAVRAVSRSEGAIAKVALAFSRSGPLSGPCYEYARRLMMGEEPVDAAVMSQVPLQLRTAIALQTPADYEGLVAAERRDSAMGIGRDDELAMTDTLSMPTYGQFIYLAATAVVTCLVLTFITVFIVPTLEMMLAEFSTDEEPPRWFFGAAPAVSVLILLTLVVVVLIPLLNRGHIFGYRLPRWIPMTPRRSERRAEILHGLADGIDAGWPIGRSLAIAHAISTSNGERNSLDRAMRLIERGDAPIDSLRRAGWIDSDEAVWLDGSPPRRTGELLREIADQRVRDARANMRWMMAIFFPLLVILLGMAVMVYAHGLFSVLTELIHGLA